MEFHVCRDDLILPADYLVQLTIGNGFSVEVTEDQKAVRDSFQMAYRYRRGGGA